MENIRPITDFKFTEAEYADFLAGIEIWRDVELYETKYIISTFGKIKSLTRREINGNHTALIKGRILLHDVSKTGYHRVTLTKYAEHSRFLVHRMVGDAFINNPNNNPEINHDNCDKSCNYVYNLFWVTSSENSIHSYKNGRSSAPWKGKTGQNHNTAIKLNQFTMDGILIGTFYGCREAERKTGIQHSRIMHALKSKKHIAFGYKWMYADI